MGEKAYKQQNFHSSRMSRKPKVSEDIENHLMEVKVFKTHHLFRWWFSMSGEEILLCSKTTLYVSGNFECQKPLNVVAHNNMQPLFDGWFLTFNEVTWH